MMIKNKVYVCEILRFNLVVSKNPLFNLEALYILD